MVGDAVVRGAGDLGRGANPSRAAEPSAGERARQAASAICLNCGAPLAARYCGECGQSAHVHTTLRSIGHDLLHGLFHFEGRIWRTVPALLLRPGDLTRRYIAGERARFVSPLALFLFTVFLLFAVFESVGGPLRVPAMVDEAQRQFSPAELDRKVGAASARVAALEQQRAALPAGAAAAAAVDRQLHAARDDYDGLTLARDLGGSDLKGAAVRHLPRGSIGSVLGAKLSSTAFANLPLLMLKLQANAHKFAWALIPLSVPFLWLAFAWRREYRLYDHTVFVIYSLSAALLLISAMALLATTGLGVGWMVLLIPLHQYRQLRGAYRIGRFGALWRTAWLQVAALLVAVLFALGLLASGLID